MMGYSRASVSGMGNKYGSRAFYIHINRQRVSPAAKYYYKIMKRLLTALLGIFILLQANAQLFTYEGINYSVTDPWSQTCKVSDGTWEAPGTEISGDVVIPSVVTYNSIQYTVTEIGSYSLFTNSRMTSITIPNTVTLIDNDAFAFCSGLTSITIPPSVTSIGDNAFCFCDEITSIAIPNSVNHIGGRAFYGCRKMISVSIPKSVSSMGPNPFSVCTNLSEIVVAPDNQFYTFDDGVLYNKNKTELVCCLFQNEGDLIIPNTVNSISNNAFLYCTNLTSVTLPNSLTKIGERAFLDCKNLTSITIPNSVTSIGNYAFSGCEGLISATIPESISVLGERIFSECKNLATITIPNSVTSIGASAFANCFALTSVTIPNSVTNIDSFAFSNCRNLTSLTLPNSLTNIGSNAFGSCSNLTEIYYDTEKPIYHRYFDYFSKDTYNTATLYVAIGGLEAAQETFPWNQFKNIQEKDFHPVLKEVIVKLPGGNLHFPEDAAGMTVRLTADDDFEFHSASLDNEDVSHLVGEEGHFTLPPVEKPTMLNVVFKQNPNSSTEIATVSVDEENVRVTVHGKRVCITGKDSDTTVRAYDLNGTLLEETADSEFYLDYSGVVILRVGREAFKFAI